jgi:hypothetical protein
MAVDIYELTEGCFTHLCRFHPSDAIGEAKALNKSTLFYSTPNGLVIYDLNLGKQIKQIDCVSEIKNFNFISDTECAVLEVSGLFIYSLATYECLSSLAMNETNGFHYSIHADKNNESLVVVSDQNVFSYQTKPKSLKELCRARFRDLFFTNQLMENDENNIRSTDLFCLPSQH